MGFVGERAAVAAWCARPAWSRRWSCRSRGCTSCACRCSTGSSGCRRRRRWRSARLRPDGRGSPADRFFVGLAMLSLLADAAQDRPLLCLVDDAQWLDEVSAQVLAFVGRRLQAESVVLLFATRDPPGADELAGLPGCSWTGFGRRRPRAADSVLRGPMDEPVRRADRRRVAATRWRCSSSRTPHARRACRRLRLSVRAAARGRIEESFRQRVARLPAGDPAAAAVAAAEPVGDATLLWRASEQPRRRRRRRRPLPRRTACSGSGRRSRSATRWCARRSTARRRRTSGARCIARWLRRRIPAVDPDRRAWHRAHATVEPDEEVALELERSADRAQARGGLGAAAAFLERAAG